MSYFGQKSASKIPDHLKNGEIHLNIHTLISPIIMNGAACWTLFQSKEQNMDALREEVRRKIYEPTQNSGIWRNRFNFYLYRMQLNSVN